MAAVPTIGRADQVSPRPGAEETSVLYERYGRRIYAYCLHQLTSREEAEDATQTTFMNAFRGLSRGIAPESEQAWLFKIAENVCLSRRRTSWRRGRIESPSDFEMLQDLAPAPARDRADELIGLEDALAAMPESQRRAILLREWQGLSYREIADELELSQAAVETLIFRARRTLATGLEEPEKTKKRRLSLGQGLNLGSLIAGLKGIVTGGAAVKAVAVTVAASTATVGVVQVEHAVVHRDAPAKENPALVAPREAAAPAAGSIAPLLVEPARAEKVESKTKAKVKATARAKRPAALLGREPEQPAVSESAGPAPVAEHPVAPPAEVPHPAPTEPAPAADEPKRTPHAVPPKNEDKGSEKARDRDEKPQATETPRASEPRPEPSSGPDDAGDGGKGRGPEKQQDEPGKGKGQSATDQVPAAVDPGPGNSSDRGKGRDKGKQKDEEAVEPQPVQLLLAVAPPAPPAAEPVQDAAATGKGKPEHGKPVELGNGGEPKGKGKDK